jgi:hypothetical protein
MEHGETPLSCSLGVANEYPEGHVEEWLIAD